MMRIVHSTSLTALALAAGTSAALAMPAVGLTGDKTLVLFDTDARTVTRTVEVTGVDKLHGIDVRPADGLLYGVSADGRVVTIDLESGAASDKSKLSTMLPDGVAAIVDFNPMADRLRLMGTDGTNLRANVDDGQVTTDGKLAFEDGDANHGATPAIAAAAYTNSHGKPEKTAMFDIDKGLLALVQQTKPNDGTLKEIGKLEIESAETLAFDIHATSELANTAVLAAGAALYTVDLTTGKATALGALPEGATALRDLAILP
ncbi:DUF4394 domain-containing protein [Zavarzinia sp. CC-PAN008]|uniref:DUF4394 domain-containing protein n=1 Tax=Zavarzinia sp. CC-PAN008 TaxID=3243332 RepID=UPI003F746480